jgi:chromosome segregation ATPase
MGVSRCCAIAVAAAVVGLPIASIQAQVARSGGAASAQLTQQMQQLASERTALQAENAKLKQDLESLRQERDALKKGQQALEQRARAAEGSGKAGAAKREATEQELAQTQEKMQQLIAKFRETAQTMREIETDRAAAKQSLATREQDLKVCIDRNLALYKLNQEVLARLEHQSVWGSLARAEPFTRIKRVELENLVDDYKGRADDQRVKTQTPPPTTPAPPVPATSTPPDAQPVPR